MGSAVDFEELSEWERKKRIDYHLAELRKLRATPRSDWHAGFEALLRIEAHKYAGLVHVSTEEEIGEAPPRMDFVILVEDERVEWDKAVFGIFRRINILEYKSPHDSLNERALRKACGYANLYIGMAEHEGDRHADQVTVSVFRAVRSPGLFEEMEKAGTLARDEVPGIYHVSGLTDLPFQVIITGELEGEGYAAYRALTDRADAADVARVIEGAGREADDAVRGHYRVLLRLVMDKNPQFIDAMRRDDAMTYDEMDEMFMEIVKDKVDAKVDAKERETTVAHIADIMKNLKLTIEQAMDALSIPQSQRGTYAGLVGKRMQ